MRRPRPRPPVAGASRVARAVRMVPSLLGVVLALTACAPDGPAASTPPSASVPLTLPPTTTSTTVPTTTVAPTTTAVPTTTVAPRPQGADVGFSLGYAAVDDTDEELARDFDAIAASGARWVRLDVDWSAIEPVAGLRDWSWVDRSVAFAGERGLSVLGIVSYSPYWARPAGTTEKHAPTDPAVFAAFAAGAAERYAGRVAAWEIWNEPNSGLFWQPRPDPDRYADLLATTTAAIRAVDGTAVVVTGGLAPAVDAGDGSELSPETFLAGVVARTDAFDAVGSHPYSYPALPTDRTTSAWNSFVRLPLLHEALTAAGLGDRPVWITEYGAPTGSSSRAVPDERQAALIVDALEQAARVDWIDKVFLFTHRDSPGPDDEPEVHFGLLRLDGSPKPAWDAVTALLRA